MKIDTDYLKKLLEACQASENPTFDIASLDAAGFDHRASQFEFHMMIRCDHGFIERDDGDSGIGIFKSAMVSHHRQFCHCG